MNKGRGFTLIELLVVVALIAMLMSITISLITSSKARARDGRRTEDIRQVQNALELYRTTGQIFPICALLIINGSSDCLSRALVAEGSIAGLPTDPLRGSSGNCGSPGNYVYCYESADGFNYTLRYELETGAIPGKSAGWQTATP